MDSKKILYRRTFSGNFYLKYQRNPVYIKSLDFQ